MQLKEARALLGRLEYQRGNFHAALQVFYGIDIKSLSPRMIKAINDRTLPRNSKSKKENAVVGVMSLHSVSLLLEAILLKAKSLQEMGKFKGMMAISCYLLTQCSGFHIEMLYQQIRLGISILVNHDHEFDFVLFY